MMKKYLMTALVTATCFSQSSFATESSTGSISNETRTTKDVIFNQPITLENSLTPLSGLTAGHSTDLFEVPKLATGTIDIQESGQKAQLAIAAGNNPDDNFVTYATGHEGDADYALHYMVLPNDVDPESGSFGDYESVVKGDVIYLYTPSPVNHLAYNVWSDNPTHGGSYSITTIAAIYNP